MGICKKLKNTKLLRRNNLFELFVLENDKSYLSVSRNRIKTYNNILKIKNPIKINYNFSEVKMTLFNDRISTYYQKLPLCNPDLFILMDQINSMLKEI